MSAKLIWCVTSYSNIQTYMLINYLHEVSIAAATEHAQ